MNFMQSFQKAQEEKADWIIYLSAVSSIVLSALISLMPENNVGVPEKYFLIASWILLTINIPVSLFASMLPYAQSQYDGFLALEMAKIHPDEIKKPGFSKKMDDDTVKSKNKVFALRCCFYLSLFLFCFSFFCLSTYACLSIL